MVQNDLKLVKDAQKGSKKAIESLFNTYKDPAFNISYRIVQRTEAAEDIVMDSFIKIMQGMFKLRKWVRLKCHNRLL